MFLRLILLTILFTISPYCLAMDSPSTATLQALSDTKGIGIIAQNCRYLTLYNFPEKRRPEILKALGFWCNSLSREAEIVLPYVVPGTKNGLVRVNLDDYGWSRKVWEKLAKSDPYFHAEVETVEKEPWGHYGTDGKWVTTSYHENKVRTNAAAPWLPGKEIASLIEYTQSQAPLLRADWWIVETSIQEGRRGTGYYDFLGLKKRRDFEQLVGLDKDASIRVRKEIAAIVSESGVALNNRQVYRYQSITGGYWVTLDVNEVSDKKNAIRLLNGDFAGNHDAEEHYGFLPNGLFAYYLSQANGTQLNTAPDNVASDGTSSSNDHRLHVGLSCVRCHSEGLRPIDDVARKLYRGAVALQSPDPYKLRRLRQLYLSDLPKFLTRDVQDFSDAVHSVNGLKVADNASLFARIWKEYQDTSLDVATAARELGIEEGELVPALKQYAVKTGSLDPVLALFIQSPAILVRREHFAEVYGLAQTVIRGYIP